MKNSIILFAALAVMAFAGCSKGDSNNPTDGRVALSISGGIETRAVGNTWEAGDAIGIYMVKTSSSAISETAENRPYSTTDGSSNFHSSKEAIIYFPVDGSQVDFLAYYPYRKTLPGGDFILDVSDQSNLSAIDLMTAKVQSTSAKPVDKNHPQVALNFVHILTKLELNITAGNGLQSDDLKGLKVEITNQRTEGSYDPLFEVPGVLSAPVKTVALNTNATGTLAQAILLPTTPASGINPIIAGREFIFTLAGSNDVFRWSVPDEKLFNRGDRNIYNITINRTSLDVTAIIVDWAAGNGASGENGDAE